MPQNVSCKMFSVYVLIIVVYDYSIIYYIVIIQYVALTFTNPDLPNNICIKRTNEIF